MLFILAFVFLIGLSIGSFVNAFEYRLYHKKDFVRDRSACVSCNHKLAWYDLVPVLSWILLRGKCRYCGEKISVQYLIVELITGVAFLVFTWRFFPQPGDLLKVLPMYVIGLVVIAALIFFTIYDLKYGLIPDKVLKPLLVFTILGYLPFLATSPIINILTGIGAGLFFFSVIFITKGRGMGGGDMKLALWLGLFFGWPDILWILYISFIAGGAIGVILLLSKVKEFGQSVPFGPFLTISAYLVLIYSDQITQTFNHLIFSI